MVIRYVIRMKNGSYMLQDFSETKLGEVNIRTVDLPIDASLLRERKIADRCIFEILTGNTNLPVIYDENNPPESVEEIEISYQIKWQLY